MRGATGGQQFQFCPCRAVSFREPNSCLDLRHNACHQRISIVLSHAGTDPRHQLREICLPEDMAEVVPGANPDFKARDIIVRLSSPVNPEATWQLQLHEPFNFLPVCSTGVTNLKIICEARKCWLSEELPWNCESALKFTCDRCQ